MPGFGRGKFGRGGFGRVDLVQPPGLAEEVSIVESLGVDDGVVLPESIGVLEDVDVRDTLNLSDSFSIIELLSTGVFEVANIGGHLVRATFPAELHHDGLGDAINILLKPSSSGQDPGAPLTITGLRHIVEVLQSGSDGAVVPEAGRLDAVSTTFRLTGSLDPNANLGDFLTIKTGQNAGTYQIVEVLEPGGPEALVKVDRLMGLAEGTDVLWEHTSGVSGLDISTSKLTDGGAYAFAATNLYRKWPKSPITLGGEFRAQGVPQPRVEHVSANVGGHVSVVFDEVMRQDPGNLGNPRDYVLAGPTTARVKSVYSVDDRTVVLTTAGLGDGEYTLTVSTSTPKDVAGNPVDPTFNEAVFLASAPVLTRSVFTDKGPIVKPPLTLQSGDGGTFESIQSVSLPGAALTVSDIGRQLRLSGSAGNDGQYEILAVPAAALVRVRGRFELPDAANGAVTWGVFDPRTGQVADDPSDVVVRVGGTPIIPAAVIGLRGQVVLPSDMVATGNVEVDYNWFSNPKVEIRRLNSLEFRLNAWNRDPGGYSPSNHQYRFNNVLVTPSRYEPDDIAASQDQPLLRDVKYRAYERAYTALLNDPTRLLFNTPIHRIAFPPAQRVLREEVVFYEASTLPEAASSPWVRKGAGTAVVGAGTLVVVDNSAGTFPAGSPLFWTRAVDLSFDHVFSVAWRFAVDAVTATEGVWTGLAAGYANARVAYVLGYLVDGGVRKIGFLRRGARDAVSVASAWTGGVDSEGVSTGAAVALDWAVLHSYRMFTDRNGVVRLYIDGSVVEALRITPGEAPFLEELNAPFNEVQGAFFGSLSRPATSTSTWDFFRYVVQPINALQTAPSSFVAYEGDILPEVDPSPWTPIGFHGTATVSSGILNLESTSATDGATSAAAGLVGGDFHGYTKLEPLLTAASQVVVDAQLQMLTLTHGVDPDGLMLAVDDGTRLLQLCFLARAASPRLSYGGRSLPEDFSPFFWSALGNQTAAMRGRTLRITDSSTTDGRVYYVEDSAPPASAARAIDAASDYILETRLAVVSYVADGDGFAGASAQAFDGTCAVGIKLVELVGVRYVALHADGVDLGPSARFEFDWGGGAAHTYRVRTTAGSLVTLFADGQLLGVLQYNDFVVAVPAAVGILSFGSSTPTSDEARSVIDWSYCNAWRVEATPRRYVGLWKGTDRDSLTGYHLPLKTTGTAAVVGNVLRDSAADFDAAAVAAGDAIIIDDGPNKGVYIVQDVDTTELTVPGLWPAQPSTVEYRVARETDWSIMRSYRLARDATGVVSVTIDLTDIPAIRVDYDSTTLPVSGAGVSRTLSGGLPAIAFGSFSAEHLEQSRWDFVRYGIIRSATGLDLVPPHQILNQWNVMESAERLNTTTQVALASFKSSSTGSTSQTAPDFLARTDVPAHTQLNQGTPPVPWSQTSERRGPFSHQIPAVIPYTYEPREIDEDEANPGSGGMTLGTSVEAPGIVALHISLEPLSPSGLLEIGDDVTHLRVTWDSGDVRGAIFYREEVAGSPAYWSIVLDNVSATSAETFIAAGTVTLIVPGEEQATDGYVVNDGQVKYVFSVPEDVLYTSLQLVESTVGEEDLLAPFGDAPNPELGGVNYQREVCLSYTADELPQDDAAAPTPWTLVSDDPDEVDVSVSSGALTYGTSGTGTRTVYLNNTPLPDAPSLRTEAIFDIRLAADATLGIGDSQVRFGLSAPGMTVGVGFVTHSNGERFVEVFDLNSGDIMGRATVDYLDGDSHRYRIVRDPSAGVVEVYIDEAR